MDVEKFEEANLLTSQDVDTVVKNSLGSEVELIDYKITNFSNQVLGFMGAHRRLTVKFRRGNDDEETQTYFIKCLPVSNEIHSQIVRETDFFSKEGKFYEYILPKLTDSIGDDSWYPRCYLIQNNFMVFENLATRNYTVKDKLLDIASVKSALTTIAKFHASTVLTEKRLGKTLLEFYPEVLVESMYRREGFTKDWQRTGTDVAVAVAKKLNLDSTLIPAVIDRIFDAISTSSTKQNVIGHGDVWSFNLMFDDSSPDPKCVLIDFQTIRYAPAMIDVIQLMHLTTRREFREENERQLLRGYYDEFVKILKSNEDLMVPSFEQMVEEYESCRIVGVVSAVLLLPFTMLDVELCADLMNTSDGFARLVVYDRVDLVLDFMEKDSLYKERMTENIKEMVERAKELLKGVA